MFRNYLSTALSDLVRNWFYAGVTILGLAVSFAAAIVIGLYLRDEYSFERFLPGYERAYRVETDVALPGQKPGPMIFTSSVVAGRLGVDFPEAESVARITGWRASFQRGATAVSEPMAWASPDFFRVMPYPVLAGDADAALHAPDGLVLTRSMARKYFGLDAPIGRTLMVNPAMDAARGLPPDELGLVTSFHPMRVLAVLQDLPSNTHLNVQVFAAGRAPFSPLALEDRHPTPFNINDLTYLKLRPGVAEASLTQRLDAFGERNFPGGPGGRSMFHFRLMPIARIHFADIGLGPDVLRPSVDPRIDAAVATVGLLIVAIAAINFVTLMTARATRRSVEVGIRKAVGARRGDLIVQFMGETLIYVLIALVLAAALTELVLPQVNAFLQRSLRFDYLGDAGLVAALVGSALLIAGLAGLYPSLALSSFRPASVLGGGAARSPASSGVRQVLVITQFAILIGLIVMTATIYRQTRYALTDALRLDTSQVAWIAGSCRSAFTGEAAQLPGVKAVSCGSFAALALGMNPTTVVMPDRSKRTFYESAIDGGFFELHGLKPLAGRFFSKARGEDMVLDRPDPDPSLQPDLVVNESAARLLGFARPADAVGKTVTWTRGSAASFKRGLPTLPPPAPSRIIGVVGDFTLGSIRNRINPLLFYVHPDRAPFVLLKLDGRTMPETLAELQRLWRRAGHDRPADVAFESQAVQDLYKDVITQGVAIGVCAALAILIACLGLFAMAAFITERRIKEIGVRKAMGAGTSDVMGLLLWQFTKPVLWANLAAWPVAFWVMDHWLKGFAYRVDLPPWLFAAAAASAVLIAWATVAAHAWLAARAAPATALRYE
jgi:putative ABC transport system permease protein